MPMVVGFTIQLQEPHHICSSHQLLSPGLSLYLHLLAAGEMGGLSSCHCRQVVTVQGFGGSTGRKALWRDGSRERRPVLWTALCLPPLPALWAPSASAVLSVSPASHPRSARGAWTPWASALSIMAQPSVIDTTSVPGCPCWPLAPSLHPGSEAKEEPCLLQSVTVRPM